MHHTNTDDVFSFVIGIIVWGISSFLIKLLRVDISAWVPPFISIFSAFTAGFMSMWGKDVYKAWKQGRGNKKK